MRDGYMMDLPFDSITKAREGDLYCRGEKAWFKVVDTQYWPKVWLQDRQGQLLLMNSEEFEALEKVTDPTLLGLYYLSLLP